MEHLGNFKIKPSGNSAEVFLVEKADGTGVFKVDSSTPALTLTGATGVSGVFTQTGDLVLASGSFTVTAAGVSRAIDIQVTPTSADRQLYMDIDYGANNKEAAYIISSSAKTSGSTTAVRARGQGKAAGASTAEIRGVHAQGIAFAALYSGTVNALYAEAIAKGTSTVVTIRGLMVACDSEATPTSITNMYGAHIRVKTTVAPGTDYIPLLVENEKFGSGVAVDSFLKFKTTTWAGGNTVATDVISTAGITGTVTNIVDYSGPTATSALYSSATITNFLEVSADSKGGAGATRATPNQTATCDGSIVVKVGSKTLLVPLYNAVTIAEGIK